MFYLTTLSTHFIYGYISPRTQLSWPSCRERKEGNVLFNNTLNTFYLRLYQPSHPVVVALLQREEGNVLFNNTLNTFYLRLYQPSHPVVVALLQREEGNVLFNNALNTF